MATKVTDRTFVYAIGRQDGPIKVGITNDLLSRLRSLQTGNAHKLDLIYVHTAASRAEALKMESLFHEVYAQYRLEGEWFNLNAALAMEGLALQVDLNSSFYPFYGELCDLKKSLAEGEE